jgi:hypothetical protein
MPLLGPSGERETLKNRSAGGERMRRRNEMRQAPAPPRGKQPEHDPENRLPVSRLREALARLVVLA